MAKKPVVKSGAIAVAIDQRETLDIFSENYYEYGMLTIEDRSLPDYRDGLLKVHRRTLWAMSHLATADQPHVKTARVVGDTIGKYHPHGDAPVSSAIETMVHTATPLVDGAGNWGTQTENAAAMRYTNCRLSEYSHNNLFNSDYLSTIATHPNYDGKDVEPVLLPSLLPTILLTGVAGIAVGMSVALPSFHKDGVLKLVKGMLQGRKLTPAACLKNLEFAFPFGGHVPREDFNDDDMLNIFKSGKGSVYTYCDYEVDAKARLLRVTGVPPKMKPETLIAKLRDTDYFNYVTDDMGRHSTTPADIKAEFKRGVNIAEATQYLYDYVLSVRIPFSIGVIERYWDEEAQKIKANVYKWGVITLLEHWLAWRKEIEAEMLGHLETKLLADIDRRNLLLLAQENRKLIASSWEEADQKAYIATKLKVDEQGAAYICGLRISQLGKLDREKLKAEIKALETRVEETRHFQQNIEQSILKQLAAA